MYKLARFEEKLNIQSCKNSTENCVRYICTECLDYQKNWMSKAAKIQRKIVYVIYVPNVWMSKKIECPKLRKLIRKLCTLYVWNVWICRKILYPKLRKFNGKLCTLYMHGTFGFEEKLDIQNYKNSTGNSVNYICTECLDLQKNWISRSAKIRWKILYVIHVWNVWICKKIGYLDLRKFNGKLCTLYMYGMAGFEEKLNI